MVSIEEVESEIRALEGRGLSWPVAERLTYLYTLRDHIRPHPDEETESSEFAKVASGCRLEDLLRVMDGHMEAMRIVCPTEYKSVMTKLRSLQ